MLHDIRSNYNRYSLDEPDLTAHPLDLFQAWIDQAIQDNQDEPTAMTLSTNDMGQPDSRIVLLKEASKDGFVFFTNCISSKGKQIEANNKVALNFYWSKMERQIRVKGTISRLNEAQSENYFKTRPRESQIGAWASNQSQEIKNRNEIEENFEHFSQLNEGKEIKKPENWGGYIVSPTEVEFWQGRPNRLHDRFRYYLTGKEWIIKRLSP